MTKTNPSITSVMRKLDAMSIPYSLELLLSIKPEEIKPLMKALNLFTKAINSKDIDVSEVKIFPYTKTYRISTERLGFVYLTKCSANNCGDEIEAIIPLSGMKYINNPGDLAGMICQNCHECKYDYLKCHLSDRCSEAPVDISETNG